MALSEPYKALIDLLLRQILREEHADEIATAKANAQAAEESRQRYTIGPRPPRRARGSASRAADNEADQAGSRTKTDG